MKKIHKIVLGLVVLGLFLLVSFSTKVSLKKPFLDVSNESETNTPEYLPVKEADNNQSSIRDNEKSGWQTYINHQAKFKINYPEELYVIENFSENELQNVSKSISNYEAVIKHDKIVQGRVMFCAEEVLLSQNYCHQGLEILHGVPMGDGWGGGCNEQYRSEIQFNGMSNVVCDTSDRIHQLYANHPNYDAEVNVSLNFANGFERQIGLTMLDSFEFVKNTHK